MSALERIKEIGVVPVVVIDDVSDAPGLADALVEGGLPCAEITLRTPAAQHAIEILACRTELLVGAGTVIDVDQARRAIDAGARFVVTPGLDAAVVRHCQSHGVDVLPGVATATEILGALREGVDVVKLFPAAQLGGPAMLAALAAPFPQLRFVPTGGVGPREAEEYLGSRAVLAVGGSWVAPRRCSRRLRFDEIRRLASDAARLVARVRESDRHLA